MRLANRFRPQKVYNRTTKANSKKNAKSGRWKHYFAKLHRESCVYAKLRRARKLQKCGGDNGKIRRNGAWRV